MSNYIDKIMSNHVFNSESSEDLSYLYSEEEDRDREPYSQKGGKDDKSTSTSLRPTGGFPPIIIINAKEKEVEQTKNRQLAPGKSAVSIKDILKSKK